MPTDKALIANSTGTAGLAVATTYGASAVTLIEDPAVTTDDSTGSYLAIAPADLVKGTIGADYAVRLTPVAVKTANYAALAGEFVPCDSTSAGFTVTLPTAPADKTICGIKHVIQGSTSSIAVTCGGSDVFNKAAGSTTLNLASQNRSLYLQYRASTAIWYVLTNDLGTLLAADMPATVALTTGSYSQPAWITAILGSIVSGSISGNAANVTGTVAVANGGTGQGSAAAAFNALSPVTTLGDVTYGSAANTSTRLAGNTTGTRKFLRQTGTGTVSAAPAWDTVVAADVPAAGSTTQTLYNLAGVTTGNANLTVGTGGETVLGPIAAPTISGTGQIWNDSTRGVATVSSAGVAAPLGGLIWVATSAGTAVASSIAQTSILAGASAVGSLTIPANAALAGKALSYGLSGALQSTGTPTLTITIYFGTTLIASTGAFSPTAAGPLFWSMECAKGGLIIQVAGASGKVYGMGQFNSGLANASGNMPSGGTGSAVPAQVSVDFTGAQAIDVRAQWSVSSASNTIQLRGGWFRLEG